MTTNRLNDLKIKALLPEDREYMLADGEGLSLVVSPGGSKAWRFAYRFHGKQKRISFGPYPKISLVAARAKRDESKTQLKAGRDPAFVKRELTRQRQQDTFKQLAEEWFAAKRAGWVSSYADRIWARIENDILTEVGHLHIREIEPPDILAAIRKIEERGAIVLAKRIKQSCSQIFQFAIAEGRAIRDPTSDITAALKPAPRPKRRSALPASQLPTFFAKLKADDGEETVKTALWMVVYLLPRTHEIRFARKDEFDLKARDPMWRIPAERMKMKEDHLVPLAPTVVRRISDFIENHPYPNNPFMFPSWGKSGVISENAMIYTVYRLGYLSKATVHGFRSTASTVLNESGLFESDWIEMQLAHDERDEVRAAYNAAQYLKHRIKMMHWYADFLDGKAATAAILG